MYYFQDLLEHYGTKITDTTGLAGNIGDWLMDAEHGNAVAGFKHYKFSTAS